MGIYSASLTTEDRAVMTQRLQEAEAAMHDLSLGRQARVFVDQNGERVEFNLNSMATLRSYVLNLRIQLGLPTGIIGPAAPWSL